jgi:hypothetical protein
MLVSEITSKFNRAYIGKANHCCCGCAGDYYEDDATKQLVIGKILASQKIDDFGFCISAVVGKKLYTAYRTDESINTINEE